MNIDRKFNKILFSLSIILMMSGIYSHASGVVEFGPNETQIKGSIKYSVIGRYKFQFSSIKGRIDIYQESNLIQSVYLEIDAGTIESDCKWCDRIVRSEQLLATKKYPKIIFKSNEIVKNATDYTVNGILELHGVKNKVSFPFQAMILEDKKLNQNILDIKGEWQINRKAFDIIWNKFLDQGGVLVGNYITVNWGIKAGIKY